MKFVPDLLPPANEVCYVYVFTPVSQSFCSRGMSASEGDLYLGGVEQAPPIGYSGIRSTSGRCASYWNAFLLAGYNFNVVFLLSPLYVVTLTNIKTLNAVFIKPQQFVRHWDHLLIQVGNG